MNANERRVTRKRQESDMKCKWKNMKDNVRKWKWKDNETETEGIERKMPDNEKRMKEKEKKMQRNQREMRLKCKEMKNKWNKTILNLNKIEIWKNK